MSDRHSHTAATRRAEGRRAAAAALHRTSVGDTHKHGLAPEDEHLIEDTGPWLEALQARGDDRSDHAGDPSGDPSVLEDETGGSHEPVRGDDPVALMLGLVPEPDSRLDGRRLTDARQRAGLDLREFVLRLQARGWQVTVKQAYAWERTGATLAPALVGAVAQELGTQGSVLIAGAAVGASLPDLLDEPRVAAFMQAWAADLRLDRGDLGEQVGRALAGAGRRNRGEDSVDALLGVLQVLRALPDFPSRS